MVHISCRLLTILFKKVIPAIVLGISRESYHSHFFHNLNNAFCLYFALLRDSPLWLIFIILQYKCGVFVCLFFLGTTVCLCFKVNMINIMVEQPRRSNYLKFLTKGLSTYVGYLRADMNSKDLLE